MTTTRFTYTRTLLSAAVLAAFATGAFAETWNTATTIGSGQTMTVIDGRIDINNPGHPSATVNVMLNGGQLFISDDSGDAYITGRVDVVGANAALKGKDGQTPIRNLTTGALRLTNGASVELTGNLTGESQKAYYVTVDRTSTLKTGGDITGNFSNVKNDNVLQAGSINVDGSFDTSTSGVTTLTGSTLTASSVSNSGKLHFTREELVTVKATKQGQVIENVGEITAVGDLKFESIVQHGRHGNDYEPDALIKVAGTLTGTEIRNLGKVETGAVVAEKLSNFTNQADTSASLKAGAITVTGAFANGNASGVGSGVIEADSIKAGSFTQKSSSSSTTVVGTVDIDGRLDVAQGTLTAQEIAADTFTSGAGSVITFDKLTIDAANPAQAQVHAGWLKSGDQNLGYGAKFQLTGKVTNKEGGALDSLTVARDAVILKGAELSVKKLTSHGLNNTAILNVETIVSNTNEDGSAGYVWNTAGASIVAGSLTAASVSNGPNAANQQGASITVDNLDVAGSVSLHRTEAGEKGVLTVKDSANIGILKNAGEVYLTGEATIGQVRKGDLKDDTSKVTGTVSMTNAVVTVREASEFGDLTAMNSSLTLGAGEHSISTLTASESEVVVSDIKGTAVTVDAAGADNTLTLRATGEANDVYVNADAAMADLQNVMKTGDKTAAQTVVLDQGEVNDGKIVTLDKDGNVTGSITNRNTVVESYGAVNMLSALLWRDTLNDLGRRMGELRDSPEGVGAWVRFYGGEQEYGAKSVEMKTTSLQIGSDVDVGAGWKAGGAFTYTDGSSNYDAGSGDHRIYTLAAYGTWLGENGRFVDLIARVSRLESEFSATGVDGDYDNTAWSMSAEYGRRFSFAGGAFVEPQVEVTYGRIDGADFNTNTGIRIEQDAFDNLIARVGARTGFVFPEKKGIVYAKFSVAHDFIGESDATVTKGASLNTFHDDVGGTWIEYGVGANFNWTDRTYTYVDFERSNMGEIKDNYKWSVGLRHVF